MSLLCLVHSSERQSWCQIRDNVVTLYETFTRRDDKQTRSARTVSEYVASTVVHPTIITVATACPVQDQRGYVRG